MAEFGIYGPIWPEDGLARIDGRCFVGTLRCGDRFVAAFEHEFKSYEEDPGRRNVRDVDLVLEAIEAYGRQIDELDQGMTAELTVRGDVRGMMDGTVLSTNLP